MSVNDRQSRLNGAAWAAKGSVTCSKKCTPSEVYRNRHDQSLPICPKALNVDCGGETFLKFSLNANWASDASVP